MTSFAEICGLRQPPAAMAGSHQAWSNRYGMYSRDRSFISGILDPN